MDQRFQGKVCPICNTPFQENDVIVVCGGCGAFQHLACRQRNHGCATPGCRGMIREVVDPRGVTAPGTAVPNGPAPGPVPNAYAAPGSVPPRGPAPNGFTVPNNPVPGGWTAPVPPAPNGYAPQGSPVPNAGAAQSAVPPRAPVSGGAAQSAQSKPLAQPLSKRFETVFEEEPDAVPDGAPMLIESLRLVADRQSGRMMARCSFRSLTDKPIKAVLADLQCADAFGSPTGTVEGVQYLDLDTARDAVFGQTKAVEVENTSTRRIRIVPRKILFADQSILEVGPESSVLPKQKPLAEFFGHRELAEEYVRQTNEQAKLAPVEGKSFWRCACGGINSNDESVCFRCGGEKQLILGCSDRDRLSRELVRRKEEARLQAERERAEREERERLEQERIRQEQERYRLEQERLAAERAEQERIAREEAERKAEERRIQKAKTKKRAKRIVLISAAVLLVGFLVYGTIWHLVPYLKYKSAESAMEEKSFDEAYEGFTALKGFSDSEEKAVEALYQKAVWLRESGSLAEAADAFERVGDYQDSAEQAVRCRNEDAYLKAKALLAGGEYEEAARAFTQLGGYADSADLALEAIYELGRAQMAEGAYDEASQTFVGLGDYADSADLTVRSIYEKGVSLFQAGEYREAYKVFEGLGDYEDSKAKVSEAMYGYVLTHKSNTDQYTFHYLQELKAANYSDAKAIYAELYQWKVTVTAINTSEHTTTNLSSISKYRPIYIHFTVSGGGPDSYTMLKFKYTLPNGITGSYDFDGSIYYSGSDYTVFWEDGIYTNPYQGSAGTLSFWFYDEDNNLIGQGSVRITN